MLLQVSFVRGKHGVQILTGLTERQYRCAWTCAIASSVVFLYAAMM